MYNKIERANNAQINEMIIDSITRKLQEAFAPKGEFVVVKDVIKAKFYKNEDFEYLDRLSVEVIKQQFNSLSELLREYK